MSTNSQEHTYFTDPENIAEMGRLTRQAQMLSREIGILPSHISLPDNASLLDIGCGPGEWVLNIAPSIPHGQVTGIDISNVMIEYARFRAEQEKLHNTRFLLMNALDLPLALPDASFDFIYARFIVGFMRQESWLPLFQECSRLLRPGGFFCHTDLEDFGLSTSPNLTRFNAFAVQAARLAGQCFTEEGDFIGITALQSHLFQQSGFQHIQQKAHSINFSSGAPAHLEIYEDRRTIMKLFHPFIVNMGVATQADVEQTYEHALEEMRSPSFHGIVYYQTTWGQKPISD